MDIKQALQQHIGLVKQSFGLSTNPGAYSQPTTVAKIVPNFAGLQKQVANCTRCRLYQSRQQTVFGCGSLQARLMLVGEGPGLQEDRQGEPFVGPAGQLLDKMLLAMGLQRGDVYIANIVKCRPPNNRVPQPDEITACLPYLRQQIGWIKPQVMVALGAVAAQTLLETKTPISKLRGNLQHCFGTQLMPTFHPAYLLRNPADKKLVWQDLQQVMRLLQPQTAAG